VWEDFITNSAIAISDFTTNVPFHMACIKREKRRGREGECKRRHGDL
jgi:hypothetical protein